MKKWISSLKVLELPLKYLFIISIIYAIGYTLLNPDFKFLTINEIHAVQIFANIAYYFGFFALKLFFPLTFLYLLYQKFKDGKLILITVFSLVLFFISLSIIENHNLASYYYLEFIKFDFLTNGNLVSARLPKLGILIYLIYYLIIIYIYPRIKKYRKINLLNFITQEILLSLVMIFVSIILAYIINLIYPILINLSNRIVNQIYFNRANPIGQFIYGISERLAYLFNVDDVFHNIFYQTELGGSYINDFGAKYIGDVNIWNYLNTANISNSKQAIAGLYTNGLYIINLFIVPSYIINYIIMNKSRKDLIKNLIFLVFALLIFILTGNILVFDLFLLISAPLLYFIYLVLCGMIYLFLNQFSLYIGLGFKSSMYDQTKVSIFNYIRYLSNDKYHDLIFKIIIFGLIIGLIFAVISYLYYRYSRNGIINKSQRDEYFDKLILSLGGINNILSVSYNVDKLVLELVDYQRINEQKIYQLNAYLIIKNHNSLLIRFSNQNYYNGYHLKKIKEQQNAKISE